MFTFFVVIDHERLQLSKSIKISGIVVFQPGQGGFGFLKPQARPKPSPAAWLRLGLAQAAAFVCKNEFSHSIPCISYALYVVLLYST
jgi:hypothetical protein